MKLSKKIEQLLASNQTSYSISKYSGVAAGNIDRLRKGERQIKNLHLDVAEKLGDYYDRNFKRNGENDMKIEFVKEDEKTYSIEIDTGEPFTETYGKLKFDDTDDDFHSAQNAWVLWPSNEEFEAVTYFEDLDETKEAIEDELVNAE